MSVVTPSPAVRRLLEGPLDSFEKLVIVLALRGAPAMTSSVDELARALQLPVESVARAVEALVRDHLVEVAGGLTRLTVTSAGLVPIDELVLLYEVDRILVMRTLSEIAMERIRGMIARAFAGTLQRRKKRDGDG